MKAKNQDMAFVDMTHMEDAKSVSNFQTKKTR